MAEPIDLSDARRARNPHLEGAARCLDCKHEWAAVAPVGTRWMECPSCSLIRGRFIGEHRREGDHWHCTCANELFYVTPDGYYCPNCGEWASGF